MVSLNGLLTVVKVPSMQRYDGFEMIQKVTLIFESTDQINQFSMWKFSENTFLLRMLFSGAVQGGIPS